MQDNSFLNLWPLSFTRTDSHLIEQNMEGGVKTRTLINGMSHFLVTGLQWISWKIWRLTSFLVTVFTSHIVLQCAGELLVTDGDQGPPVTS